ncbi:MAG: chromosomal replication initiator protein DnaA [Dehalococcoidia bacterium]|nr:chromosomal replication initiator protein DnaA [Dehalococcoidia bacterium]
MPGISEGRGTENARKIWSAALGQLQLEIPRPNYETWLKPTTAVDLADDTLTISTPSPFAAEMLEKRLSGTIHRTVSRVAGQKLSVVFQVVGANGPVNSVPVVEAGAPAPGSDTAPSDGSIDYARSYSLKPSFNFETFVVGPSNRLAQAAAAKVAEVPGSVYNPLYIYSEVGLGKTHLLHAIGHMLCVRGLKVMYVSSERFTNEYISAIREGSANRFRERYRSADVLLVDDVQFISSKPQTQEGFFHTFNELHMAGKQIVVTGDEPTSKSLLQERIKSRLAGGLEVDLQPPDYESRYAILQSKAPELAPAVLDQIAQRAHPNVRELEGALNRVIAYSQLVGSPVTTELADQALKSLLAQTPTDVASIDEVLSAISEFTGVAVDRITGKRRDKATAGARRMAMYMLREEVHLTSTRVGKALGGKDHSTVLYAQKRFEQQLETDSTLRQQLAAVRDIIARARRVTASSTG